MKTKKNRSAFFVCSLSYLDKNGKITSVEGKLKGNISMQMRGTNGFGYDPIFIPENKRLTFGQMSQKLKFKNDHRAQAYKKIKKFL